jgi:hypothetical protein
MEPKEREQQPPLLAVELDPVHGRLMELFGSLVVMDMAILLKVSVVDFLF